MIFQDWISKYSIMLLGILLMTFFLWSPIGVNGVVNDWEQVCNGTDGQILLLAQDFPIVTIREGSRWTSFAADLDELQFKCVSRNPDPINHRPNINFHGCSNDISCRSIIGEENYDKSRNMDNGHVIEKIKSRQLKARNGSNRGNLTVSCDDGRGAPICRVNVIILTDVLDEQCDLNETLSCNVTQISPKVAHRPQSYPEPRIKTRLRISSKEVSGVSEKRLVKEIIKYSIRVKNKWVYCDELNDDGNQIHVERPEETQSIRCNVEVNANKPYIIRMEIHDKTKLAAALPLLNQPTIDYTYFYVNPKDSITEEDSSNPENDTRQKVWLGAIISVSIVMVLLIIACILFKSNCTSKVRKESYMFYVSSPTNKGNSKHDSGEARNKEAYTSNGLVCLHCDEWACLCACDLDDNGPLKNLDPAELRKTILSRQLSGDPTKVNPDLALNSQAKIMAYNPKLEISRDHFVTNKMLGAGHFGSVYSGHAIGLVHPDSKTDIAIKTANDPLDSKQRTALFCEMKILSNLEIHINLVNMLGSCTTEFIETGEVFMLIEYCQQGDMKKFLIKHEKELKQDSSEKCGRQAPNNRLLINWAFDIAKGMQYLARMHIMHGDLAARNILIQTVKCENGESSLVAKVSDFGLSKTFYDNIRYKRQDQNDVPWKWMALEYLQSGHLTITSDVWSYGVVLWEILSIGREPYTSVTVDEMLSQFKNGYYLPCPEEALTIKTWNSKDVYDGLARICFIADPIKRATFSDIVQELERELDKEELLDYTQLSAQYIRMRSVDQGSRNNYSTYLNMSQNIVSKNTHLESQNSLNQKTTNGLLPHLSNVGMNNPITHKTPVDSNIGSSSDTCKDKCDNLNENTLGCDKYNGANRDESQSKNGESQMTDTSYITIEVANNS